MHVVVAIFISICLLSLNVSEVITADTFCISFCVIWAGALAGMNSK